MFLTKYCVFVFLLFFVFSCGGYQIPEYEKMADRITFKTAVKLRQEKQLYLAGTGGSMMNDIKKMNMGFDYYHDLDLQSARQLLVYVIDEYLTAINSNQKIRSYLHQYPFTAKNVEINIWIHNADRSDVSPDKIYYISAIKGILNYYIQGAKEFTRKAICTETYEEAIQHLNEDNRLAQ